MPRPRPRPVPVRLVRAAGAVVWRFRESGRPALPGMRVRAGDIEVLLVHRPRYDDWSWPKGKAEPGEPVVCAAVREVEEETGVPVALGLPLTTQRYRLGSHQTKEVHYWVGRVLEESAALRARRPVARASRREIDEVRWVTPRQAEELLTRRGDRRLLTEVLALAEAGRLAVCTVAVLRHAKALSRAAWGGSEASRPLTRLGVRQAFDAVDLLSAFGVGEVVTSPWERCRATVGPFAAASGARVVEEAALTEDAAAQDAAAPVRVLTACVERAAREAREALARAVVRGGVESVGPSVAEVAAPPRPTPALLAARVNRARRASGAHEAAGSTSSASAPAPRVAVPRKGAASLPAATVEEPPAQPFPSSFALCTHRPCLPGLVDLVTRALPEGERTGVTGEEPWLRTAEMLVIHALPSEEGLEMLAAEVHGTRTKEVLAS